MTRKEIINGLKMSMDLTLFDPSTGEVMEPWQLNEVNRTAYEAYKGAIELLEEMPSAQPEHKTGRWIWQKRFYTFDGEKREILVKVCSCCGKPPIAGVESPYCPHCGEKKESEQE